MQSHFIRLDAFQEGSDQKPIHNNDGKLSFRDAGNWKPRGGQTASPISAPTKLLQEFLPGARILKSICDCCMRLKWLTGDRDNCCGGISWHDLSVNFVWVTVSAISRIVDISHGPYADPFCDETANLLQVGPWDMAKILQSAVGFYS